MNAETHSTDTIHTQSDTVAIDSASTTRRRALYFASGEHNIFGWYHTAAHNRAKNCAAVICNPLGYEYTHSHRSLRYLADRLAASGIPTLRFDYDATGDSPGDDLAPDRVACWLQDIRAAITSVRALSGCSDICLLGVRMGAALAAVIASEIDVAHLVLWNPCSGRHYVREMKALALTAASEIGNEYGFESAGFMLLHETAEQLKSINLVTLPFRRECNVLLLQRDDMDFDRTLEDYLRGRGIDVTQQAVPGYADMMAEPQFTVIPTTAIDCIVDWLEARLSPVPLQQYTHSETKRADNTDTETTTRQDDVELIERCYQFGDENNLFGIVAARKNNEHAADRPAIILLNSGSVHHVGPSRLYVTLARKLAALGYLCLRFDLQGLGESVAQYGGRENHPYPAASSNDTAHAVQFLQTQYGCTSFVLAGLCSGAHSAFHAGIDLLQHNIIELVLINPLTFRYVEGMSLATTTHYMDVAYYKGSARNLRSWLKLLSGKVDIGNLIRLGVAQLKVVLTSFIEYQREKFFNRATTQLSADLRTLLAHNRPLSLFVASSDPGYSLLAGGAAYMTKSGIKSGFIRLQFIADGDHTFSRFAPRREVVERICAHIESRYGARNRAIE